MMVSKLRRFGTFMVRLSKSAFVVLKNILIAIGTMALLVGIQVLVCSPRDKLVSRMESWGAVTTVPLPPGRKLAGTSWKGNDLWVLTREAAVGEKSDQIWSLDEYTGWGIFNFHIVLKETTKLDVP